VASNHPNVLEEKKVFRKQKSSVPIGSSFAIGDRRFSRVLQSDLFFRSKFGQPHRQRVKPLPRAYLPLIKINKKIAHGLEFGTPIYIKDAQI